MVMILGVPHCTDWPASRFDAFVPLPWAPRSFISVPSPLALRSPRTMLGTLSTLGHYLYILVYHTNLFT